MRRNTPSWSESFPIIGFFVGIYHGLVKRNAFKRIRKYWMQARDTNREEKERMQDILFVREQMRILGRRWYVSVEEIERNTGITALGVSRLEKSLKNKSRRASAA